MPARTGAPLRPPAPPEPPVARGGRGRGGRGGSSRPKPRRTTRGAYRPRRNVTDTAAGIASIKPLRAGNRPPRGYEPPANAGPIRQGGSRWRTLVRCRVRPRRARTRRGAHPLAAYAGGRSGGDTAAEHLRRRRADAPAMLHCVALDCSGSMTQGEQLALAKGVLVRLLERAYQSARTWRWSALQASRPRCGSRRRARGTGTPTGSARLPVAAAPSGWRWGVARAGQLLEAQGRPGTGRWAALALAADRRARRTAAPARLGRSRGGRGRGAPRRGAGPLPGAGLAWGRRLPRRRRVDRLNR